MIEATNLSKRYGDIAAVDGVSFSVERGEVVGFLGPNGAGKTTTMRMLTGFLPPTDPEAILLGRLNETYPRGKPPVAEAQGERDRRTVVNS